MSGPRLGEPVLVREGVELEPVGHVLTGPGDPHASPHHDEQDQGKDGYNREEDWVE